jgi:glycerol-3-phosphate dehydrogenase
MDRMQTSPLDVLILGGGINGAGLARDLALRAHAGGEQLRIGLVEQNHFGSGTSGKNSQLIHGGLRYLKNLEFQLVREALHERRTLLAIAPHLVEPMEFLIPFESWASSIFYRLGLFLYDWLAGKDRIQPFRSLSPERVSFLEPELDGDRLHSGAAFFDCRVHSGRLVLENIFDAIRYGACAANYVRAVEYKRASDGFWDVQLTDTVSGLSFSARARKLVNATGAWSREGDLRRVRGSHIIMPRLLNDDRAIAYFERSGRIVFFIPWGPEAECTLIGTTDVDHSGSADDVHITREETKYLLSIAQRLFPISSGMQPIASYSSLRPLVRDESHSAAKTSREHRIWNAQDGILHIAGGKYTTYRLMSEEAADLIANEIAPALQALHETRAAPIGGNTSDELLKLADLLKQHSLDPGETRRLLQYGLQAEAVLALMPEQAPSGLTRLETAQIAFAVQHEMAQRLSDVLFISTYWGYERRWDERSLAQIGTVMRDLLGWDDATSRSEVHLALSQLSSELGSAGQIKKS